MQKYFIYLTLFTVFIANTIQFQTYSAQYTGQYSNGLVSQSGLIINESKYYAQIQADPSVINLDEYIEIKNETGDKSVIAKVISIDSTKWINYSENNTNKNPITQMLITSQIADDLGYTTQTEDDTFNVQYEKTNKYCDYEGSTSLLWSKYRSYYPNAIVHWNNKVYQAKEYEFLAGSEPGISYDWNVLDNEEFKIDLCEDRIPETQEEIIPTECPLCVNVCAIKKNNINDDVDLDNNNVEELNSQIIQNTLFIAIFIFQIVFV